MRGFRIGLSVASVVAVLSLAAAPAVSRFDTFWGGSSEETLRVSKVPAQERSYSGLFCYIDEGGDFTIAYPNGYLITGTTEGGTTSFRFIPDFESGDSMEGYLEEEVTVARNMDVFFLTRFTWKLKGKIRNGSELTIKSLAKGSGVGAVGIENRNASVSSKETYVLTD